jgi:NADH dehydrogenase
MPVLIWTAGVAPAPLLYTLDLPRTANGKVETEVTLQVKERPDLWALGDCAAIHDQPLQPFRFKPIGLLAGLGPRSAVAEIRGLMFSGFFAWWLWRTVYLLKLPGLERKVRVALDWTLDLVFPRDIVYLRPLHMTSGAASIMGIEPMLPREQPSMVEN